MEIESDMEIEDTTENQALTWLVRLTSGDAVAETLQSFEIWRNASPEHESALEQARRLWLDLGMPLQNQYAPRLASIPFAAPVTPHVRRPRLVRLAIAACLMVITLGLGQQWISKWRFDQVTDTGEQRTIALRDGSTMWLNTASAATIEINKSQRHVDLARGEAFFDVRHNAQRPFTVNAGATQVKVLGTAFGVYRDGEDVVVTVQRGKVQVSGGGSPSVIITPDQRIRVHAGDKIKHVELVTADRDLSWRSGRLIYEERPLSEILTDLNRYDKRIIFVQYPEANKVRMSAMIDLARLDEWYDGLQQAFPVEVRRMGPFVWVRADQSQVAGKQ